MDERAVDGEQVLGSEARVAELEAEVLQLRAQVARLRAQNAELLQAAIDRDYEKPPHYR